MESFIESRRQIQDIYRDSWSLYVRKYKVWVEAQDICDMMKMLIEHGVDFEDKVTHHDLSQSGLSGENIQAIRGFMVSMGFNPEFKPNAVIASGIANLYSKH
jgi:predicted RNase H-related nuclease YkuK (DUF458 family)